MSTEEPKERDDPTPLFQSLKPTHYAIPAAIVVGVGLIRGHQDSNDLELTKVTGLDLIGYGSAVAGALKATFDTARGFYKMSRNEGGSILESVGNGVIGSATGSVVSSIVAAGLYFGARQTHNIPRIFKQAGVEICSEFHNLQNMVSGVAEQIFR
jgi:hypothetical protein